MGAVVTWLVVPLPSGAGATRRTRTPWSLALGLFAAVPIAYLVLVVLHEIVKPLLVLGGDVTRRDGYHRRGRSTEPMPRMTG